MGKLRRLSENEKGYNLIEMVESFLTRICSILTTPYKHQKNSRRLNNYGSMGVSDGPLCSEPVCHLKPFFVRRAINHQSRGKILKSKDKIIELKVDGLLNSFLGKTPENLV